MGRLGCVRHVGPLGSHAESPGKPEVRRTPPPCRGVNVVWPGLPPEAKSGYLSRPASPNPSASTSSLSAQPPKPITEEIQARRASRIAARLPPDSSQPEEEEEQQLEEEEGEQLPEPMKVADPDEEEAEQPAPGFNMVEAEAEFTVAQAANMAKQHAILESIQDEAYVEANRQFLR
nr:armadillo-like helical domain-containing protein 4 [Aegilops tauschii subsp. strangulata]